MSTPKSALDKIINEIFKTKDVPKDIIIYCNQETKDMLNELIKEELANKNKRLR